MTAVAEHVETDEFVLIAKFAERTGYTAKAVEHKIARGVWRLNEHYIKAPDGKIHMNMRAYYLWLKSGKQSA